jgi:hypothetical protein
MRPLVLLATLLAALLAGCGEEDKTTLTTISESTALPITVERSGGVAGIHDRLVVHRDETGTLTRSDGTKRKLTAEETSGVRAALREIVLQGLDRRYSPPSGVEVADGIDYTITGGGVTIVVEDQADDVPSRLEILRLAAADVMNG